MSVKTRFLILSDTHSSPLADSLPRLPVDVAIHCGDLTNESKIGEFRTTLEMLKSINAPLKLIIPGNHDFTMDIPVFKRMLAEVKPPLDPALINREFGDFGDARGLFEQAAGDGIVLLNEGVHRFTLPTGALLTVYASPYTSSLGEGGFQFRPEQGHDFSIASPVDLVITHGPPRGILDMTNSRQRAGYPGLFEAVARARPKMHCFGHIHEGWGTKLVTWRDRPAETPSHFTDINNDESMVIETLASIRQGKWDNPETIAVKSERLARYTADRCCQTTHCAGDDRPLRPGCDTLFVNAAIQDVDGDKTQLPWVVDIDLPWDGRSREGQP